MLIPLLLRSEEHTSELQSRLHLVCRLLLEKKTRDRHQPRGRRDGHVRRPGGIHPAPRRRDRGQGRGAQDHADPCAPEKLLRHPAGKTEVGRRLSRLSVWACLALLPWSPSPARAQADGPWTSWRIGALVRALAVQGDSIWIGTANGMLNFHIPTEQHRVYTTKDGLLSNVILGITVGPKGDVWIGTYGGGLTRFDGKSRWTTYTPYGAGVTGDYRASYARYKPGDGLGDLWVYQTMFRPDGTLWAATWKGASRYNGKTFTTYTTADGLAAQR